MKENVNDMTDEEILAVRSLAESVSVVRKTVPLGMTYELSFGDDLLASDVPNLGLAAGVALVKAIRADRNYLRTLRTSQLSITEPKELQYATNE